MSNPASVFHAAAAGNYGKDVSRKRQMQAQQQGRGDGCYVIGGRYVANLLCQYAALLLIVHSQHVVALLLTHD